MLLEEDALERLEDDFDIECSSTLAREFNARVSIADADLVVDAVDNTLLAELAEIHASSPLVTYDRLRELEKTHKTFFVYEYLIDAAIAGHESLVEVRMWQLEAARRIDHAQTWNLTFYLDGQMSEAKTWASTHECVVPLDEIDGASPLAPVERRINALMECAAVKRLDSAVNEDVAEVVRLNSEELPAAARKLQTMDAERTRKLTAAFRAASQHPSLEAWFEDKANTYLNVLPLTTYLLDAWHESVPFHRRGRLLSGAEWILGWWLDSNEADVEIGEDVGLVAELEAGDPLLAAGGERGTSWVRGDVHVQARLSWTAYVGPTLQLMLLLGVAVPLGFAAHPIAGVVIAIIGLTFVAYRFAFLRSVVLFSDDEGIWVQRGVLPWDTGAYGVKWRDLDEAAFFPGLLDWLTRSYTIVLGHRFTKEAEVAVAHVAHGDQVVIAINARHQKAVGER